MKHLLCIVLFLLLPMSSIAQQQNSTSNNDTITDTYKFGLHYAIAPDFNLPQTAKLELPFFCALEKKIALTIKSDVKLGIEPCTPIPHIGPSRELIETPKSNATNILD